MRHDETGAGLLYSMQHRWSHWIVVGLTVGGSQPSGRGRFSIRLIHSFVYLFRSAPHATPPLADVRCCSPAQYSHVMPRPFLFYIRSHLPGTALSTSGKPPQPIHFFLNFMLGFLEVLVILSVFTFSSGYFVRFFLHRFLWK